MVFEIPYSYDDNTIVRLILIFIRYLIFWIPTLVIRIRPLFFNDNVRILSCRCFFNLNVLRLQGVDRSDTKTPYQFFSSCSHSIDLTSTLSLPSKPRNCCVHIDFFHESNDHCCLKVRTWGCCWLIINVYWSSTVNHRMLVQMCVYFCKKLVFDNICGAGNWLKHFLVACTYFMIIIITD